MKALSSKGHPAKQTFQAIRIEVNNELDALKKALKSALDLLLPNGRICVITFNSLEDRIVKNIFKEVTFEGEGSRVLPLEKKNVLFSIVNRKVIVPKEEELENNPRSKSAKLIGGITLSNMNAENRTLIAQIDKSENDIPYKVNRNNTSENVEGDYE